MTVFRHPVPAASPDGGEGASSRAPSPASVNHQALLELATVLQDAGYHFVTITPKSHAMVNERPENRWARRVEDVLGWSRPFRPDILPPGLFELMQKAGIVVPYEEGWRSLIRLTSLDGKLFVHSAFPTISRDSVFFGPDTYKFVDAIKLHLAQRETPVHRAVDICTGAGPGGLAIASRAPDADIVLVDINDTALSFAQLNASLAGLGRVTAVNSDMLSAVDGTFDLVVAHPPYLIDRGSRAYRHGGGPLGAELSIEVIRASLDRLTPNGVLLLFTGVAIVDCEDLFRSEIASMLSGQEFQWSYREVDPDVFGEELANPPYDKVDRIALIVLEVSRSPS